jgi:Flp pilus assembly pilin Flp
MKRLLGCFFREEAGQDVIEYALLGCFISVVALLAIQAIGPDVDTLFTNIHGRTAGAAGVP